MTGEVVFLLEEKSMEEELLTDLSFRGLRPSCSSG